jgi:hypothetical protein
MADDVAELAARRAQHVAAPARPAQQVEQVGHGRLGRRRQPVLHVLVALAEDGEVEREHQRGAARRSRALDQALDERAVAQHVELEPERLRRVRGNVFDRADAHRRQRERHAELLGGARRMDLAVCPLHAGQPGRRERDRHRHRLAEHGCGDRTPVHVHRDALAELQFLQVGLVRPVGALGPGPGIAVVVEHARGALLVQYPQVFDVGDDGQGISPGPASAGCRWQVRSTRSIARLAGRRLRGRR